MSAAALKLSASNIGWEKKDDARVLKRMRELGFSGLEVAPTRLFPENPYAYRSSAAALNMALWQEYRFTVPSMQSIWNGVEGNLFEPKAQEALLYKTRCAFRFARNLGCRSLVFGCPRARNVPEGREAGEADDFFRKAARLAESYGCHLAMEANPPLYGTNFLNTTAEVFAFVKRLGEPGLSVNLDVGAMIENGEEPESFAEDMALVSHVHVSEPGLVPPVRRELHGRLAEVLRRGGYRGFVSLEMRPQRYERVEEALLYCKEVFLG